MWENKNPSKTNNDFSKTIDDIDLKVLVNKERVFCIIVESVIYAFSNNQILFHRFPFGDEIKGDDPNRQPLPPKLAEELEALAKNNPKFKVSLRACVAKLKKLPKNRKKCVILHFPMKGGKNPRFNPPQHPH